jgi:hypothetical protein
MRANERHRLSGVAGEFGDGAEGAETPAGLGVGELTGKEVDEMICGHHGSS